ncbi:hypothetical protein OsJ_14986 [Oryza sativa Japonica Group]|uniref:Uncharacterized protein n=1 Tax=Oryza sativa subsp. japonica TaxID=39947 RepID=B9FFF8_ORYSJ|nr:hypothetical protein OsJ_14986 [Oryza sativa Japonica Group]
MSSLLCSSVVIDTGCRLAASYAPVLSSQHATSTKKAGGAEQAAAREDDRRSRAGGGARSL